MPALPIGPYIKEVILIHKICKTITVEEATFPLAIKNCMMPMQHIIKLLRSHLLITTNIMCRYPSNRLDITVTIVTVDMTTEEVAMELIASKMPTVLLDAAGIINATDHIVVFHQLFSGFGGLSSCLLAYVSL